MENALKYDQNSLIASLKWAKSAFSASRTSKMTSLIKMSEVDFFTQMTPFSAILPGRPCCSFWALKTALKRIKIGIICSPVALLRLQNVFFMLLDHKNELQLCFRLPGRLQNKADRLVLKEPFKGCFEGFLRLKRGFFYVKCAKIRSKQPHSGLAINSKRGLEF